MAEGNCWSFLDAGIVVGAYLNRGNAYVSKGSIGPAISDYTKATEASPKYAIAFYARALASERKGDRKHAILDYRRALAIDPSLKDSRDALGRLGARP